MVVRTWAIWSRERKVGVALPLTVIALVIPVVVIQEVFLKSLECAWMNCALRSTSLTR